MEIFQYNFTDIRKASAFVIEDKPSLKNLGSGSGRNKEYAQAIADAMGRTVTVPYS